MKDQLGDRMKRHERVTRALLIDKLPTIIRLDGKAFHTLTKHLYPFDRQFKNAMCSTTERLLEGIQGAKFAYTQSDEISIFLTDWDSFETELWFGGVVQKIASVSASMATVYFNALFTNRRLPAFFDSRVFQLPSHEVANYFIWRQLDSKRNSVNTFARQYFSQKELDGKPLTKVIDMLSDEVGIDFHSDDFNSSVGEEFYWGSSFIQTPEGIEKRVVDFIEHRSMFTNLL